MQRAGQLTARLVLLGVTCLGRSQTLATRPPGRNPGLGSARHRGHQRRAAITPQARQAMRGGASTQHPPHRQGVARSPLVATFRPRQDAGVRRERPWGAMPAALRAPHQSFPPSQEDGHARLSHRSADRVGHAGLCGQFLAVPVGAAVPCHRCGQLHGGAAGVGRVGAGAGGAAAGPVGGGSRQRPLGVGGVAVCVCGGVFAGLPAVAGGCGRAAAVWGGAGHDGGRGPVAGRAVGAAPMGRAGAGPGRTGGAAAARAVDPTLGCGGADAVGRCGLGGHIRCAARGRKTRWG